MQLHGNAKLVPSTRLLLVTRVLAEDWKVADVAAAQGVSQRTVYRWLARWRAGDRRLVDRSSAPKRVPRRTPRAVEALIERLRRLRMTSTRIAARLHMAVSTVGAVLVRLGLNRLSRLEPPEPANRYCRRHPRRADPRRRQEAWAVPYAWAPGDRPRPRPQPPGGLGVLPRRHRRHHPAGLRRDPQRRTHAELCRVPAPSAQLVRRPRRPRSARHDRQRRRVSLHRPRRHLRRARHSPPAHSTPPAAHQREAERFIQTMLREWAYAAVYQSSDQRALALGPWLDYYNQRRPHGALGHQPPAARLRAT